MIKWIIIYAFIERIRIILMEPSITDWIQAGAAFVGVPALLIGLYKLFVKDKEKQQQIDALVSLADAQQKSIEELTKQTGEFKYHSSLMKESNEILTKWVEIQSEMFLHQKVSKEDEKEIEDRKRKQEIRPYFIFEGFSLSPGEFAILLLNKGGVAKNVQIGQGNGPQIKIQGPRNMEYAKGTTLHVHCAVNIQPTETNSRKPNVSFSVEFEDIDGNKYEQTVSNHQSSFEVGEPRLK